MRVRPAQAEHPIFDANRAHLHVVWKLVYQRAEWFRPIISQFLHQRDPLGVQVWDCNSLRICPGDDDLTLVPVLATILEVVRGIQN